MRTAAGLVKRQVRNTECEEEERKKGLEQLAGA